LLGFAIFGFVLDDPVVQRHLAQNLPRLDMQALRNARGTAGVIAFVGLPVTGWFWVDALRCSIRKVWGLPEYPGALVIRVLLDLLARVGSACCWPPPSRWCSRRRRWRAGRSTP
jgi:membrane protein